VKDTWLPYLVIDSWEFKIFFQLINWQSSTFEPQSRFSFNKKVLNWYMSFWESIRSYYWPWYYLLRRLGDMRLLFGVRGMDRWRLCCLFYSQFSRNKFFYWRHSIINAILRMLLLCWNKMTLSTRTNRPGDGVKSSFVTLQCLGPVQHRRSRWLFAGQNVIRWQSFTKIIISTTTANTR